MRGGGISAPSRAGRRAAGIGDGCSGGAVTEAGGTARCRHQRSAEVAQLGGAVAPARGRKRRRQRRPRRTRVAIGARLGSIGITAWRQATQEG
jgi:hypothetical protein